MPYLLPVRSWDHPRVCGEKSTAPGRRSGKTGSPPRMRGKGQRRPGHQWQAGITPAYAGKSRGDHLPRLEPKDHPRVCGEKEGNGMKFDVELGSPPRMRGKDPNWTPDQATPRITPAYAGKRCGARLAAGHRRDHPRVCGEKTLWQNPRWKIPGSPPRMRGKAFSISLSASA